MADHMKTTIQIPDSLLDEARRLASKERTTVKALIEEGLRRIVAERKNRPAFRLKSATFRGNGFQPAMAEASWEKIRNLSYEGRGG